MPVAEMLAKAPAGDHLLRRPGVGPRRGRAEHRPGRLRRWGADPRHLLRRAADRAATRRRGPQDRHRRVRPHRCSTVQRRRCLFADQPQEQVVWMSHGDSITGAPAGFTVTACTSGTPVAGLEDRERGVYGVQFHPEVMHTERGMELLKAFLYDVAGCAPDVDARVDHRARRRRDPRAGRQGTGHLRAVGRCRLRSRGRARAQGDRRPAHVRVRRHRLVARTTKPTRWRRRSAASSRSTSCT